MDDSPPARLAKPTVYHIPVCPFSQRLEILLALKGLRGAVDFHVVDITKPRAGCWKPSAARSSRKAW
jgi:glutathionyl-hydroquinone reductase